MEEKWTSATTNIGITMECIFNMKKVRVVRKDNEMTNHLL